MVDDWRFTSLTGALTATLPSQAAIQTCDSTSSTGDKFRIRIYAIQGVGGSITLAAGAGNTIDYQDVGGAAIPLPAAAGNSVDFYLVYDSTNSKWAVKNENTSPAQTAPVTVAGTSGILQTNNGSSNLGAFTGTGASCSNIGQPIGSLNGSGAPTCLGNANTPGIAGGGALAAGSNGFVGTVTGSAATGNVLTPGFTCTNKVVCILSDETTLGGAKVTASNTVTCTYSATNADTVDYMASCR